MNDKVEQITDRLQEVSPESMLIYGLAGSALVIILAVTAVKFARRLRNDHFISKWKVLQSRLPYKHGWRQAIIEADDLLGDALKKKKIKGRTMGERMVNAQKKFTDNNSVWYGHKLRKKLDDNPNYVPKKNEVKKALLGLRTGLKDIGAM